MVVGCVYVCAHVFGTALVIHFYVLCYVVSYNDLELMIVCLLTMLFRKYDMCHLPPYMIKPNKQID